MKQTTPTKNKLKLLMLMTFIAGLILIVCFAMVFLLHMKDTVKSRGVVKSVNRAEIVSPANGLLKKIYKRAGDSVEKGELMLEIYPEELIDRLLEINGELAEEKALLKLAQCKLVLKKQNPLPKELWNIIPETKFRLAKKSKSEKDLKRAARLFRRKIISEKAFQIAELEYSRNCIEYEKSIKLKKLVDAGLVKNIIKDTESEVNLVNTRISILEKQKESLEQKIEACVVVAPHKGRVIRIPETTGLHTIKNTRLIKIVWGKNKFIRTRIPENSIQDVAQDQPAICYSAHYDKLLTGAFKGKVSRILSEVEDKNGGRFYEVDIKLMEEPKPLRLGSSVDVQIITGRKTIFNALTKNY